jgi:hypothetical protein
MFQSTPGKIPGKIPVLDIGQDLKLVPPAAPDPVFRKSLRHIIFKSLAAKDVLTTERKDLSIV